MNSTKVVSGIVAFVIYIAIIFLILFFYNIHQTKAKNYVKKNSDRVTVTLVNSDKTVFNKSSKVSTPKKPQTVVTPPIVKKKIPKKVMPKKVVPKKTTPKKVIPKKVIPKKTVPKKIPKKVVPKKVTPKKVVPKKIPKKVVPKKIPKKVVPKKVVPKPPKKTTPKKVVPKPPKRVVPKKTTAKDLFATVKTETPVKKAPKQVVRPVKQPSSIRHNASMTDRIKATHQSGRVSNANREKGIENAYIAKVKQHMNNWHAVGAKGQLVTVHLTIFQSGKFRYTVRGVGGSMKTSLTQYLKTLNSMGLGRHKKSTPYSIQVRFRVN